MRRYPADVRKAAVDEVIAGVSYAETARHFGATPETVRRWVDERDAEFSQTQRAPKARAVVIEVQTARGRMLAVENVSRAGEPLGTITRVGGALAGPDGRVRGKVVRRWAVDAALMRSLMDRAVRAAER